MADADGTEADGRQTAASAEQWNKAVQKFELAKLERVQSSARVWLGVLTTLLGLLGSVVLIKGGDLVTEVTANGAFQTILIFLVAVVLAVTVLAVIFGGQATWGGLGFATSPPVPTAPDSRPRWRRAWFRVAVAIDSWSGSKKSATGRPGDAPRADGDGAAFRDWSLASAERHTIYLHASRSAGVLAAALIALLAIVAIMAGTVSPAPSYVIVVHHGRVSCSAVTQSGTFTGVTQVVTVGNC